MGKGSKRQNKSHFKPHKKTYPKEDDGFGGEEDLDDEIDAFHKQQDVIPLDINEDDTSDEEMEYPVFDFKDGDDSDDEDEDCGDAYNQAVERPTPFEEKIVRQAKFLKQRIGGDKDDTDDEDDDIEEKGRTVWGRHKKHYFNADNTDFELQSSDEDLQAEEEEAIRIQREKAASLSMRDFGLDEDEDDFGEKEKSLKDASIEGKLSNSHTDSIYDVNLGEDYINVKKDANALLEEEQMDIVYRSAPELVGFLSESNEVVDHIKRVNDLICKIKEKNNVSEGALQYLVMKKRLLLIYCQAIAFFILLKSEGHSVIDHPVISRLVEIKKMLGKVKRLDEKIPYENLEALLNNSHHNVVGNDRVKESVTSKAESVTTGAATDGTKAEEQKSATISEDTVGGQNEQLSSQSKKMLKLRASLEEKWKQKGIFNNMKRKHEGASKLVNKRIRSSDYDDEVAEPMDKDEVNKLSKPVKLSQMVASRLNKRMKVASGEDDVPIRDDIGERRRKYELRVLARAGACKMEDDNVSDEHVDEEIKNASVDRADGESEESEDEFYKEVKQQRSAKLLKKSQMYSRVPTSQTDEIEAGGRRPITYAMEKNRGLTRYRKKLTKNPRKKYKVKHQKAVMRRKGQVRNIRMASGNGIYYGGESTGINTQVSHSIRFKQ